MTIATIRKRINLVKLRTLRYSPPYVVKRRWRFFFVLKCLARICNVGVKLGVQQMDFSLKQKRVSEETLFVAGTGIEPVTS